MGYHFCDSLLDYCDPDRSKYYQCLKELEEMEKHMNLERVFDNPDTPLVEISLDVDSSSRGSDSSDSNDSQTYLLKLTSQAKNKKKCLKTKRERNATLAIRQNNIREVYGKEHLLQRYEESNSNVKGAHPLTRKEKQVSKHCVADPRPSVPDVYMAHCFRRPLPNQGLESHHELKIKAKNCTSFKRTGTNWTDDEKRIYRDKRIAQTQEILQYLLPIVDSSKNMKATQVKDLFNQRGNLQQHQLTPTACINVRRHSTPWTSTRNHPFKTQRSLVTKTSEWLRSVPQEPFESLSPLCSLQKRKKHSELWAQQTEDVQLLSSKWEAAPSGSKVDADRVKGSSQQPEEPILKSSEQRASHLKPTSNPVSVIARSPSS